MRLSLLPVGHYAVVAALAASLLLLLWLGPSSVRLEAGRRRVLRMLRLGVVALVIVALLRPSLVYTSVKKQSATLVVLIDRSRSMLVEDAVGSTSRWQALKAALADATPALVDLAEDLEVKLYTFGAVPQPVEFSQGQIDLPPTPDEHETAIGSALEEVLREQAGKRFAGIILLSDGAQRAYAPRDTPPQTAARQLGALGYPLYTLTFGQPQGPLSVRDVALANLRSPQTVFAKNELNVAAALRAAGLMNHDLPVRLLFETSPGAMKPVAAATLRPRAEGEELPVELTYIPQAAGEYKITLEAAHQPGELVTTNNQLSTFVTVLKGGLNVLYLEGALRPEQTFLRRAIGASPNIKVDYLYINAQRPETRPADLASRFEKGKYDVYIIGDLDSAAFDESQLATLRETVRAGAGLIMCGGLHSFGAGAYGETPLADLLPIETDRLERQRFDEPTRTDLHLPGQPKMRPTAIGRQHYVMLMGPANQNADLWERLRPLDLANRFRSLKPRANVLAESQDGAPLLVAHDFGQGRVMAFAGWSTWRWQFDGHDAVHKRFWRQVVLWLARKEKSTEGRVEIQLAERRFAPAARVEFTAEAFSPEGDRLENAVFDAQVTLPDGSRKSLRLVPGRPQMLGSFFDTRSAGDYTLEVAATHEGVSLGTARARFLVVKQDLELDQPAADPTMMANLASITGGESLAPEELSDLIERLKDRLPNLEIETETTQTLWDTWPFFALVIGLLATEWWLRKKWGLV